MPPSANNVGHFMQRALDLARQGRALVSPNPRVGAVLVRQEQIVGEGYHRYAEKKHAETWERGVQSENKTQALAPVPVPVYGLLNI